MIYVLLSDDGHMRHCFTGIYRKKAVAATIAADLLANGEHPILLQYPNSGGLTPIKTFYFNAKRHSWVKKP